jgi:FkbM family methyltransferase
VAYFRTVVERLSRGKSFWRRLPKPFSTERVLVTPDAALSCLRLGDNWCDAELLNVASRFIKTGNVVWDIGANLGVFGVAAAARSGKSGQVLCVEPDIVLVKLIRATAARLSPACAKMEVLAAAVAKEPGIAAFDIAERGRASNTLAEFGGRSQTGGIRERQLVPVVSLDSLLQATPAPAFVKIDVEGAESAIFSGATRLLSESRPLIYIEVGPDQCAIVTQHLKEASYDLFDPSKPLAEQSPSEQCHWNTLAIPKEYPRDTFSK